MPKLVNVSSAFENQPWVWRRCAAPDCGQEFPTQDRRQRYCALACVARVGYYRRRGRPFPDRSADGTLAPRSCAEADCGALFVPVQAHQRVCSHACGVRSRVRAWSRRRKEAAA